MTDIVQLLKWKFGKLPNLVSPINSNKLLEEQFKDLRWNNQPVENKIIPSVLPTLQEILSWENEMLGKANKILTEVKTEIKKKRKIKKKF
ncbi:MAG: hypothetical protein ACFFDN_00905 [Candidatus Hodarchaeota archaeon]